MSVLIKGMEMPQCCGECKFMVDRWCYASEDAYFVINKRHPDCPLVEVPTHGDLIDKDAIQNEMYHKSFETDDNRQKWDSGLWIRYKIFEEAIADAPTVIESEE